MNNQLISQKFIIFHTEQLCIVSVLHYLEFYDSCPPKEEETRLSLTCWASPQVTTRPPSSFILEMILIAITLAVVRNFQKILQVEYLNCRLGILATFFSVGLEHFPRHQSASNGTAKCFKAECNCFVTYLLLGMFGFVVFWSLLMLRIYLPEEYWKWSYIWS